MRWFDGVVDGVRKPVQQRATNLDINERVALRVAFDANDTEEKLINELTAKFLAPIFVPSRCDFEVFSRARAQERIKIHRLPRIASATSRARSPLTRSDR